MNIELKEIRHIRTEIENETKEPREGSGHSIQVTIDDILLSATSESSGNVFGGTMFSQSEDLEAVLLAKKYDVSKSKVLNMWKDILNIAGTQSNGFLAPDDRPPKLKTITEEKDEYKRLIQKAVGGIHHDFGLEYSEIHMKLNSVMGTGSSKSFTLKEYKRKLELAKQLYHSLKSD